IEAEKLNNKNKEEYLGLLDGIVVPGGFDSFNNTNIRIITAYIFGDKADFYGIFFL
ncbi:unnamed protein product, partial [marine sediment metagenome]